MMRARLEIIRLNFLYIIIIYKQKRKPVKGWTAKSRRAFINGFVETTNEMPKIED